MKNIDKIYNRIAAVELCLQNDNTPGETMFFIRLYVKHLFDELRRETT